MHNKRNGFSLIELLIVMALIVVVLAMSSDTLTAILRQSSRETKIAGTQIEGIIGLDFVRLEIEQAGYGLPWSFQSTAINYSEAAASLSASTYNDSTANPPRAIISGNDVGFNGSDYLVIKSTIVGIGDVTSKWSYIKTGQNPRVWGSNDLINGDRVIVVKPNAGEKKSVELVMSDGTFFTRYSSSSFPSDFSPKETSEMFLIYGVDTDTDLRMPFNRADYYIKIPTSNMPASCAPGTGVLYKATVNQSGGGLHEMPILDCVADMQIVFGLDTSSSGSINTHSNDISTLTAEQIRTQLKEVRVYILIHEGPMDRYYTYSHQVITIGEFGVGRDFDLLEKIGTGWQNYRWKINTLVIKPKNLFS